MYKRRRYYLAAQALGVDVDSVADTVQPNYMSFISLMPDVPGGNRHDWDAEAPLQPPQQVIITHSCNFAYVV